MFCCALSFLLSSFKLANQNLILHNSSQLPTPSTILLEPCFVVPYLFSSHLSNWPTKISSCTRVHSCRLLVQFCRSHVLLCLIFSPLIFQTGQPKSHLAQQFTAADSFYNSVGAMFCCALSFLLSSFKLANQNLILHNSSQLPTPSTILLEPCFVVPYLFSSHLSNWPTKISSYTTVHSCRLLLQFCRSHVLLCLIFSPLIIKNWIKPYVWSTWSTNPSYLYQEVDGWQCLDVFQFFSSSHPHHWCCVFIFRLL